MKDPVGYWTLGWGARYDKDLREVVETTKPITLYEADRLLKRDLKRFEDIVNKENLPINQKQFDALVSFAYNLGSLKDFPKKIRAGTFDKEDFLRYVYAKKVKLPGLVTRRERESSLYFGR